MAIAVLISSAAEAACFTAIGLDLAARLDTPVLFLCLQAGPTPVKKKPDPGNSKERVKSKPEKSVSSAPTESAANPSTDSQFLVSNSYLQETRQAVAQALGTMAFGYVATDTVEIPNAIDGIRKWLVDHHESPNLGHFDIETLVIPTLRGPGLEKSRTAKELLFECSQVETVLVSVDQSLVDPSQPVRLPLNNIGIMGQSTDDILNASRFARRFSHVEVRRLDRDANEPQVACAIMAIPGKAQQTRIDNNALWKSLRKNENIPLSMVLNPADSIGARVSTAVDDKLRHWFSAYQLSREDRIRLSGKLEAGAASSPEFILFMSLATFLACVGLIQDSAAVIIGAMLVAPLMVPLLGAGLAMIFGNRLLFAKSLRSIMLGVGLAFAIGTLVGLFSLAVPEYLFAGSGLCLTNEMIARSQPNLLDPFIGLAAGLAGGFAIGRDGQIGTVAGVAIAAALVPPIATAGLEAALAIYCSILDANPMTFLELLRQDPGEILQNHGLLPDAHKSTKHVHLISAPLILFALNACATIIGAYLGLRMVGMHRSTRARPSRNWVALFLLLLIGLILALMLFPLLIF